MRPTDLAAVCPALLASAIGAPRSGNAPDEPGHRAENQDDGALPRDTVFELLKNERRRRVLRHLREHDESTLAGLAERIAAIENDVDVTQVSSDQRKRVYVALYQCHLPRLDDADVVDYDRRSGTVRLGPRARQLFPYLDVTPIRVGDDVESGGRASAERVLTHALLLYAVVVAGAAGAGLGGVAPLDSVTVAAWPVLALVAVLSLTVREALRGNE